LKAIAKQQLSRRLQAKCDPADLVQETALEASRDFAHFHGNTIRDFAAWLRQILLNNAANINRSYARTSKRNIYRETSLEQHLQSVRRIRDQAPTPTTLILLAEERQCVEKAYWQLPADMRLALHLRSQTDASFAEIGDQLDRSPEAARKVWVRAVQRLKLVVGTQDASH
jgi:RNA polymerase sigma-70 factor (ECF subfamily)